MRSSRDLETIRPGRPSTPATGGVGAGGVFLGSLAILLLAACSEGTPPGEGATPPLPAPSVSPLPRPSPSPISEVAVGDARLLTYESGAAPRDFAFDGEHIWLTHFGGTTVSKWSQDGRQVATYESGRAPRVLAFDGQNMWVGNADNSVTKLSLDGEVLDRVLIGGIETSVSAILFDGKYIWVAASWGNSLTKLSLDGKIVKSMHVPGFHPSPWALAFDGEFIWLASVGTAEVQKIDRDATIVGSVKIGRSAEDDARSAEMSLAQEASMTGPSDVEFDGEHIWVAAGSQNMVVKLDKEGNKLASYPVEGWPMWLLFDGDGMWVTQYMKNQVLKLALDGTPLESYPTGTGPYGLASIDGTLWVSNFEEDTIIRVVK